MMPIECVEFNVLIQPDPIPTQTKHGLAYPETVLEQRKHAQTIGTMVQASPLAFNYADWPEGARKPEVGDRVIFARHAGTFVSDPDGNEYRACKDKDIVAVIR